MLPETDSTFEVECKDFSSVEFMDLLDSLQLNDKEQVAVNILMAGGAKGVYVMPPPVTVVWL